MNLLSAFSHPGIISAAYHPDVSLYLCKYFVLRRYHTKLITVQLFYFKLENRFSGAMHTEWIR